MDVRVRVRVRVHDILVLGLVLQHCISTSVTRVW
jgi:hypothetical protein